MIRANLLPRTRQRVTVFGIDVDLDVVRRAVAGLALALLVGSIGATIERIRIDRLQIELESERRAIAANDPARATADRLARAVARYEAFSGAADAFRRSGTDAAIAVARVGNVLPAQISLDALDRDAAGFALTGESTSIDGIGSALARLARAAPPGRAEIVSIDARTIDRTGIRFSVRLDEPTASATP